MVGALGCDDDPSTRNMRYNGQMLTLRTARLPNCRRFATALLATLLAACAPGGPDAAFETYLARLSRTLSVAAPAPAGEPVTPMPPPRELHLQTDSSGLDVLDFLSLHGCAVQVTIGKRNSSLGRLARDSQRLLLDLEYLELAPACVAQLRQRGEEALANTLEQAWSTKRRQLPAAIFNATLGGSEYRAFWRVPANPGDYPATTGSAVIASLEHINRLAGRWLAGDYRADNLAFELLLADVATGDGGALRQALAAQAGALAAADGILAQRRERGPLCAGPIRPAAADILPNVVRLFFVDGIQPRAALLNRRFHQLLPPVAELEQLLHTALPPAYRTWQQHRDATLAAWVHAPRQHVEALQATLQPCLADDGA